MLNDGKKHVPDILSVISYGLAAVILIPIGWWLKSQHLFGFGDWVVSFFH